MKFITGLLIFAALLGSLIIAISRAMDQDAARERQHAQEWLTFSMQHHCRVVRESSFSNPETLWQCDGGFEVER